MRHAAARDTDLLAQNAVRAKLAESRADEIVKETRVTVRRIPGTEVFRKLLEVADDAADDLEDSAFLAGLLSGQAMHTKLPPPRWAVVKQLLRCRPSSMAYAPAAIAFSNTR